MKWLRRGHSVVIGLEGDTFHIMHGYAPQPDGSFTCTHHTQTTNAREAAISYATAIEARIVREVLDQLEPEGYDRHTGEKTPCTQP